MPMRCASATKRSTVAMDCVVVGTQCKPRPLSPWGWGYPFNARAPAALQSAATAGAGLATGSAGALGRGRFRLVGGRLSGVLGGAGVVVGLWAGVVGLWAPFAGWLIDARPAFIGLTYGFGTGRADVARDKTVSKLGRPSVDGFASGD